MDLEPGEFRIIPKEQIKDFSCGTHNLPLSLMMDFIQQSLDVEMLFVGVQPVSVDDGEGLSPEVFQGLEKLTQALIDDPLKQIQIL